MSTKNLKFKRRLEPRLPAVAAPTPPAVPASKKFIFKPELLVRVPVSYPTIWKWMCEGKFPAAVEVGERAAWLESDIDAWMSSRPAKSYNKSA